MAGHSKFKNIMHRKGAQDKKRAKLFTKLVRELLVAAAAGPDPVFNPRLRLAILAAREANLPRDKIDNAIQKASSPTTSDQYEEMRYEGYGTSGVALIVEALTDNKNRTASDIRSTFSKFGGTLAETGSVNYMFNRLGFLLYESQTLSDDAVLEAAIEAGADDCESHEGQHEILCSPDFLHAVKEKLETKLGEPRAAKLIWKPANQITLNLAQATSVLKLIDALEENDDVQNVWGNFIIPDEVMEKIE